MLTRTYALALLLAAAATLPTLASAQNHSNIDFGQGQQQRSQSSAQANVTPGYDQDRTAGSGLRIAIGGEVGWRYIFLGQERIPRNDAYINHGYHAALRFEVGGPRGGFYSYYRFDAFAPDGLGGFPFMAQVRVGYFRNVHYFDRGGPRSSTTTTYQGRTCDSLYCYDNYRRTTRHWWEPAGWVNGMRFGYVGGRMVYGTEKFEGDTEGMIAGAVSLGIGIIEHKFATWFAETELLYFVNDWQEEDRSHWGWYLRGGALYGPVFIDFTVLLDPAIGADLSVGLGVWLGN